MRPTPRRTDLAASGGRRTGPSRASRIDAPLNSFRRRFLFFSYCTRPRCCCFSFAAWGLRDSHSRRICRWLCPSPPAAKPNPRPVAVAHRAGTPSMPPEMATGLGTYQREPYINVVFTINCNFDLDGASAVAQVVSFCLTASVAGVRVPFAWLGVDAYPAPCFLTRDARSNPAQVCRMNRTRLLLQRGNSRK